MTITSYPFDNQDTTEVQYSLLFREFQDSGIVGSIDGPGFTVSSDGSGLDVQVTQGFAIVQGHAVDNSAIETLVLDAATSLPRIDRVVLRLNAGANSVTLAVVKGTPASSPVAPALTQTPTGIYEVPVARIAVAANALNVTSGNITDERTFSSSGVGSWTTANRPAVPRKSKLGLNSTTGGWEYWNGSVWTALVPEIALDLIEGYRETRSVAGSSGTVTLNLDLHNVFDITPTGAITIALTNASSSTTFTPVTIRFNNSSHAVTWPAGTKFANGIAPALSGVTWISGVVDSAGVLTVGASWSAVA